MERVSRDEMLLGVAKVVALRGTCSRLRVGAVVSRDGRIISTGYNGAPSGLPHCDHSVEEPPLGMAFDNAGRAVADFDETWHITPGVLMAYEPSVISTGGCQTAEHAERNAIAFAARYGLALEGSEIHTTHAPCLACARTIINAGIIRVSYEIPYRLTEGVELLAHAGLEVVDMANPL